MREEITLERQIADNPENNAGCHGGTMPRSLILMLKTPSKSDVPKPGYHSKVCFPTPPAWVYPLLPERQQESDGMAGRFSHK